MAAGLRAVREVGHVLGEEAVTSGFTNQPPTPQLLDILKGINKQKWR